MKSYSSSEVIDVLESAGWYLVRVKGDHHQFKHPVKKNKVTVTHPKKDLKLEDLKSIERQSGLKIR